MKDTASGTFAFLRFTVLVLLLFSCVPLTLISGTGAAASSLSGAGPRGTAVSNAASLTNCRVISCTLGDEMLVYFQRGLSTLVIKVSDAGLVTANCQASWKGPNTVKDDHGVVILVITNQGVFEMSGNKAGNYLTGTFTWNVQASGVPGSPSWDSRYVGSFKSEDVTVKTGTVTGHFYITDTYIQGQKADRIAGVTIGSFDAVFTTVGFNSTKATANADEFSVDKPAAKPPAKLPVKPPAKPSAKPPVQDTDYDEQVRSTTAMNKTLRNPEHFIWDDNGKLNLHDCFIATAAYGSQTAPQLDTLRAFRDRVLMKSEAGTWFVETYYQLSPPLADFIADKDALRWIVRFEFLDPIVFILKNSQQVWNN